MSIDLTQFRAQANVIGGEHRDAIAETEKTARDKSRADADYHKALAVEFVKAKHEFGSAAMAETMAKGTDEVTNAKQKLTEAEGRDRAAMERVRLARDDRQTLERIAAWSQANERMTE